MNCFQKNYLWTDLQVSGRFSAVTSGCELLSKKLPLDWFTGLPFPRCRVRQLWIAFKKTTFGLIYRLSAWVHYWSQLWIAFKKTTFGLIYRYFAFFDNGRNVVNCFQKNYLWTDLQVLVLVRRAENSCELLSKKLPLDWFTGPGKRNKRGRRLWIAFKKTTFGLIYRGRLSGSPLTAVVNCFQKNYLWTDLQVRAWMICLGIRCELLSKKLPLDWFTGIQEQQKTQIKLWIAFKKTTFGLIYRKEDEKQRKFIVVNCFQKNYLWTDLQVISTSLASSNCCELLSKKLPLDWFTGRPGSRSACSWLWIAFKKTTFGLIYRPTASLSVQPSVVNCFQKNYLWTDLQGCL